MQHGLVPVADDEGAGWANARVADFSRVNAERLTLTRPRRGDLEEVHQLYADPGVWEHVGTDT